MFRVYVNYPNNKAIVHRENCGCYRGIDKTHNGYWKHGFETAEQALEFARNTGKQRIDFCALCCPDYKLMNEIFLTFSIWEFYEVFGKVITSNKTLRESEQIDLTIPHYLWNSCDRDIVVRLNSLLRDSDPRNLSLLRILYEIEEEDCQIENFRAILKGDFHLLSQRLKENVKKFKCKLGEKEENFLRNQNLFEKLQNHLKELLELAGLFSSKSLLKNIESVKKIKEDVPEVKELFEVKENLEETLKDIESKIGSIKEKEILTTIRKLNLEKDWENFKIEFSGMNIEAILGLFISLKGHQFLDQHQQEISSLNNNIKCLDFLKEEFETEIEGIEKNIEQLYQSLVFKRLREVRNEYIAHFPKKELPKITISFEETKEVVEKTIKEITKIIGINISSVVSTFLCKFFIERQIRMYLAYFCMSPAHLHF